jgi:riboflavin kinase/FMN adenylyltransferase
VVALGTFDGVHLGHRAILGTAVARARGAGRQALACTFEQHPMEILQPARAPRSITTMNERLELIGATGVDGVVVLSFTPELAAVEPEAFVKDARWAAFARRRSSSGSIIGSGEGPGAMRDSFKTSRAVWAFRPTWCPR